MAIDLKSLLAIADDAVELDSSKLGDLATVFATALGVDKLTVGGASVDFTDGDASATLKGNTSLFQTSNLAVSATFTTTADQKLAVTLKLSGTIGLRALMTQVIPAVPTPADLSISDLTVELNPGDSYSVSATLAESPAWKLNLGPAGITISDVKLKLACQMPKETSGDFSGTIDLGDGASFNVTYDLPGDFEIDGTLPDVTLSHLIAKLSNQKSALPTGFDVTLKNNEVLVKKDGDDLEFNLGTKVNAGYAAFEVQKSDGKWGFALGFDVENGGLASLSGLSDLKPFDEFIGLEDLLLVATSIDDPDFAFSDFSQFDNPDISGGALALPDGGLIPGLNFDAKLSTGGSKAFQTVSKFLKLPLDGSIEVDLQVGEQPSQDSKLSITVNETVHTGITLAGTMGGMLQGGEVAAFLQGTLDLKIQGEPVDFGIALLVLENGVLISGGYTGTIAFGHYFSLSDLNAVVGLDFEGVPSIGVACELDIPAAGFDSSLAVFFDSDDPAKSMIAGAISDLSLKDIVDHLAGSADIPNALQSVLGSIAIKGLPSFTVEGVAASSLLSSLAGRDLDTISKTFSLSGNVSIPSSSSEILLVEVTKGQSWSLTDLTTMTHYLLKKQNASKVAVSLEAQIYVAPEETQIGEVTFPEGFHLYGELDFLILKEKIKITIDTNNGIAADVDVAPIILLNKDFLAITGAGGKGGPKFSMSTFEQPSEPPQFQAPHLYVSGQIALLGFAKESLLITLSEEKGFHFSLTDDPLPGVSLKLYADFDSVDNMDGGGSATVGVNDTLDFGKLGSIPIDIDVSGGLGLGLKGTDATAHFSASFEFEGQSFTIAKFNLDINTAPLEPKNLKKLVLDKVKDALSGFLAHAGHWLLWEGKKVFSGVEKTAKEIGSLLSTEFKLDSTAIAKKTHAILGYAAHDATVAVHAAGAILNDAASALQQTKFLASDAGDALHKVFNVGMTDVSKALGHAKYTADQVGSALKTIFDPSPADAAKALKAASFEADDVAGALKGTFTNDINTIGSALHTAKFTSTQAAGALKSAFGSTSKVASEIGGVMKNSFGVASSDAVKGILSGAGFVSSAVSSAAEKIFPHVKIGHVKVPHVKTGHIKIGHVKL